VCEGEGLGTNDCKLRGKVAFLIALAEGAHERGVIFQQGYQDVSFLRCFSCKSIKIGCDTPWICGGLGQISGGGGVTEWRS
jgi:hypothetical protein